MTDRVQIDRLIGVVADASDRWRRDRFDVGAEKVVIEAAREQIEAANTPAPGWDCVFCNGHNEADQAACWRCCGKRMDDR